MPIHIIAAAVLWGILASTALYAQQTEYEVIHEKKTNATILVFKSDKGDVYFNHDIHQLYMKSESCALCHKPSSPTTKGSLARLDQRMAHYFCKGCHHNSGSGPTECHECHKLNKSVK
jgi:hypothetical protein